MPDNKGVVGARIKIKGKEIDPQAMALVVVDLDIGKPDLFVATLNNTNEFKFTKDCAQGDAIEFKIGPTVGTAKTIFKGEIIGLDPTFDVRGPTAVKVTAVNKLHRLTRERKSKTYVNKTDHQICDEVCKAESSYGLKAEPQGSVSIQYPHVYQQHQTDLEFLLERARRINYEILCDNQKLIFRERKFDDPDNDKITCVFGREGPKENEVALERFSARLNSASQMKKVKVHGWNPGQTTEILGECSSLIKVLGKTEASAAAASLGKAEASYQMPILSTEEANALAKAILEETALDYINADGMCKGDPRLKPGITVDVVVDPNNQDERFNGKYYIAGVSHRYTHKAGGDTGGYAASCKFRRNAEGKG